MKYTPAKNNTHAFMLSVFFTVVAVISILLGSKLIQYKWLFQLLFLCFATAAIQFLIKYVLTTFEYVCEDGKLLIYKGVGKRNGLIASIPLLSSVSYVVSLAEFKKEEQQYKISDKFIFTRNLGTKDIFCYVTDVNGKSSLITLECNDEFAKFVNSAIDIALKGKNDDEI